MATQYVKRTINYYEIEIAYQNSFHAQDGDQFRELFRIIINLARGKSKMRYQYAGERAIFIQDITFEPRQNFIIGKIRAVRKDLLPEIMSTKTDEARGIEAADDEGLVETTHFVIDYSKKIKKLIIEHNHYGAKINDFIFYLQAIGTHTNALKTIGYRPIIKDELERLHERIRRCSEFKVRVHKNNIAAIEAIDGNIFEALRSSIEHFESDYATVILKFDYRRREETNRMNQSIFNLINKIRRKPDRVKLFNELSLRAEDRENNEYLAFFDLLIDKERSEIRVVKKDRYRTLISEDVYEKMKSEYRNKRL